MTEPTSPGGAPSPSKRWRKAVARVCAQKAVLNALEPEPAWREFRPYAALLVSGFFFSPISQAILITSVGATYRPDKWKSEVACHGSWWQRILRGPPEYAWWWPPQWWRGLYRILAALHRPDSLQLYLKSAALFAMHDAVTRGRTHWVEQATDVGAARPRKPFWRCLTVEACCGIVGAQLSLEYMRHPKEMQLIVSVSFGVEFGLCGCWRIEFFLEVAAERQGALQLGYHCPMGSYLGVVLFGILNFLPWGLMVIPCKWFVERYFGQDPIVAQKAALDRVSRDLRQPGARSFFF
eukprot:s1649_g3.t1